MIRLLFEVLLEDDASLPEPDEVFDVTNERWSFLDASVASVEHVAEGDA